MENTEMGHRGVECEDVIWSELVQDRVQMQTLIFAMLNRRLLSPYTCSW
jgi:hypothetical protein